MPVAMLVTARLPLVSSVAVANGVWIACDPPPVTSAVLVKVPAPTTVTVPEVVEAHVVTPEPFVCRKYPFVPPVVGNVRDHVPAAEAG